MLHHQLLTNNISSSSLSSYYFDGHTYGIKQHREDQWSPYTNNGGTTLAIAGKGMLKIQ